MASTSQLIEAKQDASPLGLWHLLSLDAPTVAALWTWYLARANHIRLPIASSAAMALAVWMLYAADRLLDARSLDAPSHRHHELEARHRFHHRHRSIFLIGIAIAAVALAALLPRLEPAAIHLYLTEGALLFAWFLILHATRSAHRLPKEIAVGLFFAAATFIPTVARAPALRLALLPAALVFAALCSLNCLFIYAWEHEGFEDALAQRMHPTTRLALRHLLGLTVMTAVAAVAIARFDAACPWAIPAACALSAALLFILDRYHHRLPDITLRAAADLALLTPLAFLVLLP